jgi:F-type H+-transporting ATPase subunit b
VRGAGGACAILLLPGRALAAAGGGEGGEGLLELVWHLVNLALLLGVLVYFGREPIRSFFAERRRRVREELEGSARLLADAEARLAEWQGRVGRLDAEVAEIRSASRRLAEAQRERILADARAGAERLRRDAAAAVEQELRRARTALREEAADLAVAMAERLLRERVDDGDRARLVDEFVERVGRPSERPGGAH